MFLLAFLLIPATLAVEHETTINNYVVKIDEDMLTSVNPTSIGSLVLNLSGLGLRIIEANVFDNLVTLENLDLSNNLLSSIPAQLFSTLGNLKHLSLANNNLTNFKRTFEDLDNLKTLNISNNPLTNFTATTFSGLPKSSLIFTNGLSLETLNAFVFETELGTTSQTFMFDNSSIPKTDDFIRLDVNETRLIKICIDGDVLKTVEHLERNESLPSGCRQGELSEGRHKMYLNNLGIARFERDWYRLKESTPMLEIRFTRNNIKYLTPELLNDIPSTVFIVDLGFNKIERIEKDILENNNILILNLRSNRIREIEDNAFMNMTHLFGLDLNNNLLSSTTFVATLPSSCTLLFANANKITEISPHVLGTSNSIEHFYLSGNQIQEVKSDSLNGFPDLYRLELSDNRINKIEPTSFQQLRNLHVISFRNNSIVGFENGTFVDQHELKILDVSYNKLSNIKDSFLDGIPTSLIKLILSFNDIEKLESDNFKDVPLETLVLKGNKISKIEHGAFELPTLKELRLNHNKLAELDTESFQGLNNTKILDVAHNRITRVPKGFTRNMKSLDELNLSYNPIYRLQNGALHGFRKTVSNNVYLKGVPMKIIEAGLFDDM